MNIIKKIVKTRKISLFDYKSIYKHINTYEKYYNYILI